MAFPSSGSGKSWTLTRWRVLQADVLELSDQFLLLGIHRNHRGPGADVFGDLVGQVGELGVPVGVLASLGDLRVGL